MELSADDVGESVLLEGEEDIEVVEAEEMEECEELESLFRAALLAPAVSALLRL